MIHKAKYLLPGAFFPEEATRVLEERSVDAAAAAAPAGAYCFTLFDTAEPVDLGPEYRVLPTAQNESGRHFLGGAVYTLAEVEAMGPDFGGLASNMRANGWERAIRCRPGNWQPFADGDQLIEAPSSG